VATNRPEPSARAPPSAKTSHAHARRATPGRYAYVIVRRAGFRVAASRARRRIDSAIVCRLLITPLHARHTLKNKIDGASKVTHPERLYRRMKDDDVSPLDTCDMHRDRMITVVTHRAPRIALVGLGALEPIMVDRSARFLEAGNLSEFCLAPVLTIWCQATHAELQRHGSGPSFHLRLSPGTLLKKELVKIKNGAHPTRRR
jgi:hypothetical protein